MNNAPLSQQESEVLKNHFTKAREIFSGYYDQATKQHTDLNPKKEELCVCFPIEEVRKAMALFGDAYGSQVGVLTYLEAHAEIRPRKFLENNPDYVHLITYFAVRKGNFLAFYNRGKTGGEEKLSNKASMGFGGHVNLLDVAYREIFQYVEPTFDEEGNPIPSDAPVVEKPTVAITESVLNAFRREMHEEIEFLSYSGHQATDIIPQNPAHKIIFADVDDDNGVHRAHLGVVGTIDIPAFIDDSVIELKENDFLGWYPIQMDTLEQFDKVELWSRLLLTAFCEGTDFGTPLEIVELQRRVAHNSAVAQLEAQSERVDAYTQQIESQLEGTDLQHMVSDALNAESAAIAEALEVASTETAEELLDESIDEELDVADELVDMVNSPLVETATNEVHDAILDSPSAIEEATEKTADWFDSTKPEHAR